MVIQSSLPSYGERASVGAPTSFAAEQAPPADQYTPAQEPEKKITAGLIFSAVAKGVVASALIGGGVYLGTHNATFGLAGAAVGGLAGAALTIYDALNPKQ